MKYFYVFQNKTFEREKNGGYLWAPNGHFSHWKNMQNVKKGDVIFNGFRKKIVAISIANSDCYNSYQPKELQIEKLWTNQGWKVDCTYYIIKNPILTSDFMDDILKIQPKKYAPFNKLGRGNTGYLFDLNKDTACFLYSKIISKNMELKNVSDSLF